MTPNRWHRLGTLAALFAGLACHLHTRAADGSAGVPLPGLVSEPKGSVRATSADLDLAGDSVVLRLKLRASGPGSGLSLRGPLFTWLGEAETYPDRHFPELQAQLKGEALPPSRAFTAMAGPHDVTADVTALDLDPFVIATTPPLLDPAPAADSPPFKRLLAHRAVQVTEGQPWARWQARRLWHFKLQPSRDGDLLDFQLSFTARPGLALVPANALARALPLGHYCVSAAQVRDRLAALGQATESLVARSYAIAVGVDGRAPESVTAKISDPRTIFCGADGQPAFGGPAPTVVRVDRSGFLRILRLDKPG